MSTPPLEQFPLVVYNQSAAAATAEGVGFLRLPKELWDQCLGLLSWAERVAAAPASRGFNHLVTQYSWYEPPTRDNSSYGLPTREIGLPLELFLQSFGFLNQRDRAAVPCIDRASRLVMMDPEFSPHTPFATARFCAVLEQMIGYLPPASADEAPRRLRLPCSFAGCDHLPEMKRKMHEIKKTIVIELSKLSDEQLMHVEDVCRQMAIPAELRGVVPLARVRKELLSANRRNDGMPPAYANELFGDDEEVVCRVIEQYGWEDRGLWLFVRRLSERLKNKENGRILLNILQQAQPSEWPSIMIGHVTAVLKGNREFMKALLPFNLMAAIRSASDELKNDGPFMLECLQQALQKQEEGDSYIVRQVLINIGLQLRDDERFMLQVLQCYPRRFGFAVASERLRQDPNFRLLMIQQNPEMAQVLVPPPPPPVAPNGPYVDPFENPYF